MPLYKLALFSGILLALTFYPFYFWPLAFVALAPLFYCIASGKHSRRQIFLAGFITGGVGIAPLVLFSLAHLTLFPDALLFTYAIRLSSIPALMLIGSLFGLGALLYRELRTKSAAYNALLGASVYTLVEQALMVVFGGYYYGAFSHAVVAVFPLRILASISGSLFVSFVTVAISVFVAEAVLQAPSERKKLLFRFGLLAAGLVFLISSTSSQRENQNTGEQLAVSVVQVVPEKQGEYPYGREEDGLYSNPVLKELIAEAARASDIVIYPHSPVRGAVYADKEPLSAPVPLESSRDGVGEWLRTFVSSTTAVVVWNTNISEGNEIYDEYVVWQGGEHSVYRKRALYALSDYAPAWAHFLGIEKNDFALKAGDAANQATVHSIPIGGLICSELHQPKLARNDAQRSDFYLAIGSDHMFPGDLSGNFSLAAARYRAVENNRSVIRANIQGPSAIIDERGVVKQSLAWNEAGILRSSLQISEERKKTTYGMLGKTPLYALVFGTILVGVLQRFRFPRIPE